jgi:hypothetical protein
MSLSHKCGVTVLTHEQGNPAITSGFDATRQGSWSLEFEQRPAVLTAIPLCQTNPPDTQPSPLDKHMN